MCCVIIAPKRTTRQRIPVGLESTVHLAYFCGDNKHSKGVDITNVFEIEHKRFIASEWLQSAAEFESGLKVETLRQCDYESRQSEMPFTVGGAKETRFLPNHAFFLGKQDPRSRYVCMPGAEQRQRMVLYHRSLLGRGVST
jgi:hypothetical protein